MTAPATQTWRPRPATLRFLRDALAVGIFTLAGAPVLSAQPPVPGQSKPPAEPRPPADRDGGQDETMRREVMDQMRAMRMWKLTEELRLDEKQAALFFPLLARFDEREQELAKQQAEVVKAMRAELDLLTGSPNKVQLGHLTDKLLANRSKKAALDGERAQGLRKILDPVQQARLVLLLPRMDDAFRRHMRRALHGDKPHGHHHHHDHGREPGDKRAHGEKPTF